MFYTNFLKYCEMVGKSPYVVATAVGVKATATISGWRSGAQPRPRVVDSLIKYFKEQGLDIEVADLFSEEQDAETEVREMLRTRPEAKILFDASRDAPPSALLEAAALIMKYKEKSSAD
jgi:hypothetical protein